MAALSACDEYVLFSNGIKAAVIQFRCPDKVLYLDIPKQRSPPGDPTSQGVKSECNDQNGKKKDDPEVNKDAPTAELKSTDSQKSCDQNLILASRISRDGKLMALCDDSKHLHVYQVEQDTCRLMSSRCVNRRVTSVQFSRDNSHVVVVDRSGDAYRFPVLEQKEAESQESPSADGEEATPGGGTLLLGHLSMVLDVLLVENDSLIVTCDRDEKIRVSRYPDGFQIDSYCLGHTQFVLTLAYDEDLKLLMSGSGDATVRVWTLDGQEVTKVNMLDSLPKDDLPPDQLLEQTTNTQLSIKESDHRLAVQSVVYCSKCHLLFVSLNRSRHVLVYRLTPSNPGATLSLLSVLSGSGTVQNVAVSNCVLWVTRKEEVRLRLWAYNIEETGDTLQITEVGTDTVQYKVVESVNNCPDLTPAPPSSLDLSPLLWKTAFQEDFKEHWKIKRTSGDNKVPKESKKQKVEVAAT